VKSCSTSYWRYWLLGLDGIIFGRLKFGFHRLQRVDANLRRLLSKVKLEGCLFERDSCQPDH